ncbi:hypothetical protein ACW5WQ_20895 [Aeromonas rivuli]|uniref:hypothetical protein n=1 Tax=Aeromonas rivuli TaxID=648794 RepID=UPI0005A64B49|nr:hypothetical protein [Aeromonas rivuli]
MREAAYPLDIAAAILECQPKKIMTEWAKGTIKVVLDFGEKPSAALLHSGWGGYIYAPATTEYFPDELLTPEFSGPREDDSPLAAIVGHYENRLEKSIPAFQRDYSQSGFYFEGPSQWFNGIERLYDEAADAEFMQVNMRFYGYWAVPYEEFSRMHVQGKFKLKPYSPDPLSLAVTLTCNYPPEKKNLRITETEMQVMRELLGKRSTKSQGQTATTTETTAQQEHKHVERFALGRERILAAALYVAHHYKPEIGKSFKSHAECIEKYGYLFWKDEAAPDHERITKVLSDATRRPEEWKILGGNANKKK